MPKPVITFVFKVLGNALLRYILYACPNLWKRSCSKCYPMHCFGAYFTHAQTCHNVRVQSATPKPAITFVFKVLGNAMLRCMLYTCPSQWQRSCSKCYTMNCFGTYFAHAQSCHNVRVQSARQCNASVHAVHMPKPVITFVFKVLHNALLLCILCNFGIAAWSFFFGFLQGIAM